MWRGHSCPPPFDLHFDFDLNIENTSRLYKHFVSTEKLKNHRSVRPYTPGLGVLPLSSDQDPVTSLCST
jgi:hypothetical protein